MGYRIHWEVKGQFKGVAPFHYVSSLNQTQVFEFDCE